MDGWPLFKISQPHESNDVLLSVDHGSNSHWNSTINGHERFLQIIQEHYQDYTSQSRLGKPKIALAILDKWRKQEPPGRFLKVVDNTNPPLWEDVGDKKALSCISKALKITSRWASEEKTTSLWDLLLDSLNLDRNREDKKKNALDWKNSKGLLYGREYQTQQLLAAYNRRRRSKPEDAPEIVLVSGPSGTGKTILANSIRKYVESDGGIFVFRKFDSRQQNATPLLAPFSAAFRGFTKQVKDRGEDTLTEMRKSIMDALGVEVQILADAIPSLRDFLGLESKGTTDTMIEEDHDSTEEYRLDLDVAEKRLRFISLWRRLMQAIASPERPIYLLADDLQWADPTSLEVIAGVLSPKLEQISGLMVLATVRGNDVSASDNLSRTLRVLEDQGTKITLIEVANLSVEHISSMLSDLLGRSTEDCLPLAEVVHAQTNGNPLFAREYLIQLNKDGILYRDHASGEWNWKEDEMIISLEEKGHSEMVVRLLARKLRQMPSYVLDMLKVASCLGDDFEEDMLCHSGFVVSSHVLLALEIAEEQNIIEYDYDRETGHFVHDKLRETAYSLIPSEEKTIFHLTIGRNLRKKLSVNNSVFTRHIFIVVDQMRYGDSLISNLEEKDDLSKLSLWASRAAAEMSAFAAAVEYADFGIKHLWQRHWRDQYGLSLDIYSTSIELAYCTGNLEKVDLLVKEVAVHARTFRDKQRALMTQVVAYGSRANAEKAIELCSEMLREVGEPFPIRFNLFQLILEYTRVRCKLMHMNEEDILSLKKLTDPKAMAQKQIIMLTYAPLLLSNYKVSPLPGFWLIRLSLKFGISSLSKFLAKLVRCW